VDQQLIVQTKLTSR